MNGDSSASPRTPVLIIIRVFFSRYRRIVAIMKLTTLPDPAEILSGIAEQEISHFVNDALGEELKGGLSSEAIGQLASAISEEILNLHLYLDVSEVKEKLRKDFENKFFGAKPKKEPIAKDS